MKMKLAILMGLFLVASATSALAEDQAPNNNAPLTDSQQISNLIKSSGVTHGYLDIVGHVVPNSNSSIAYDKAYLGLATEPKRLDLTSTPEQLEAVVKVLDKDGIQPNVIEAGTTYVEYYAEVNCPTADTCTVAQPIR